MQLKEPYIGEFLGCYIYLIPPQSKTQAHQAKGIESDALWSNAAAGQSRSCDWLRWLESPVDVSHQQ